MLDESVCHFRWGGGSDLFCHFYSIFIWKILLANNEDPDVASDLDVHCFTGWAKSTCCFCKL